MSTHTRENNKKVVLNGTFKKYKNKRKEIYSNLSASSRMREREARELEERGIGEFLENYNSLEKIEIDKKIAEIGATSEELKACERVRHNQARQRQKIEEHIEFYLKNPEKYTLYFATFTRNEKELKIDEKFIKRRIVNGLSNAIDWLINIDYGAKKERPHYHAVVIFENKIAEKEFFKAKSQRKNSYKNINFDENYEKKHGFTDFEKIENGENDAAKTANYLKKLVLHSVKVKQTYISCKKGTPYQAKKFIEKQAKNRLKKIV